MNYKQTLLTSPQIDAVRDKTVQLSWVKLFGHKYTLFEDGSIWSKKSQKFLKPYKTPQGYLMFDLWNEDNKLERHLQHRLIAKWFIPNQQKKPEVNHKNGVRDDNRLENLEWVTSSENQQHAYSELGNVSGNKGKSHEGKLSFSDRLKICEMFEAGTPQRILAEEYGVSQAAISYTVKINASV